MPLDGVGTVKNNVKCVFTRDGFDLTVTDLNGKNYRMLKDNLEKDIVASESKFIVKKDRVTLKLKKVKGEFSYDSWTTLTAKKNKQEKKKGNDDPMGGIMDLMKVRVCAFAHVCVTGMVCDPHRCLCYP